jgi:hypothetical protein
MNEKTLKQIVLIHPVRFVCASIKEFAASKQIDVYFMEAKEEFTYLINDLKPEALIVHHSLMRTDADFVQSELAKAEFTATKLFVIGEFDNASNYEAKVIPEPFSIVNLTAEVSKNL